MPTCTEMQQTKYTSKTPPLGLVPTGPLELVHLFKSPWPIYLPICAFTCFITMMKNKNLQCHLMCAA